MSLAFAGERESVIPPLLATMGRLSLHGASIPMTKRIGTIAVVGFVFSAVTDQRRRDARREEACMVLRRASS